MEQRKRKEQQELILRFLICTAAGFGIGELIGLSATPTIAVSAILMLYIDRGYTGSLRYSRRRIQIQLLMGGLALLLITALRALTPLPDWGIGIITAMIAITAGLALQDKYQIAPLTVTVGNAALIMTKGILSDTNFYWQRVLYCVLGAVIAHLVNFLILPRGNRYQEVCQQLKEDAESLARCLTSGDDLDHVLRESRKSVVFLEKQIGYLKEDRRWKHQRMKPWCYAAVSGLLEAERRMLQIGEDLQHWNAQTGEHFQNAFQNMLEKEITAHLAWACWSREKEPPKEIPPHELPLLYTAQLGEIVLAADLICYAQALKQLRSSVEETETVQS